MQNKYYKFSTYPFFLSGVSGLRLQHTTTTTTAMPVIRTTEQPTIMYINIFESPRPSVN